MKSYIGWCWLAIVLMLIWAIEDLQAHESSNETFVVAAYGTIASGESSDSFAIEAIWEVTPEWEADILYVREQICQCNDGAVDVSRYAGLGLMRRQDWLTKYLSPKLRLGLGVMYINETNPLMGSQLNFNGKLSWQFTDKFSVGWKHLSNAGTAKPNRGQDLIGLTWRF